MSKILIIEDEAALQLMYKFKLEASGFEVAGAANGSEGLRQAKLFAPDLILLDLRMPIMSGDEMLAKLRQTEWGAAMRVIILTNISRQEAPSSLQFLNVDRYIVKAHSTPAQIVDVIHEVLD